MNLEKSEIRGQRSEQSSQLSTLNSQPSIELRIEELVLHGFAPGDRYTISDAVERELARLLGKQGIPISLRSESQEDEIRGKAFNAAHDMKPPMIARQIATAVYQAFRQ
jgi:hypothetical protein